MKSHYERGAVESSASLLSPSNLTTSTQSAREIRDAPRADTHRCNSHRAADEQVRAEDIELAVYFGSVHAALVLIDRFKETFDQPPRRLATVGYEAGGVAENFVAIHGARWRRLPPGR